MEPSLYEARNENGLSKFVYCLVKSEKALELIKDDFINKSSKSNITLSADITTEVSEGEVCNTDNCNFDECSSKTQSISFP